MKHFESFRLDTSNQCLWRDGIQVVLRPKPFAVLQYLVENPARLITYDELLDALWPETYVQPQVLRTYMLELRKIFGDDAGQPRFIQTVPKRGYRFVAPVTNEAAPFAAPEPIAQHTHAPQLVGREEDLACLDAELRRLASGERRVVFVTGEAGIGKSTLVDAFCHRLSSSQQTSVARGQCIEGFAAREPYYPIIEALRQLCASPDGEMACRLLARIAPIWFATLGRDPEPGTAATAQPSPQDRLPGTLCTALEELSTRKPLVLVVEDLHWADDSTLNLISALSRRRAQARLMVVATFRPCGDPTAHPLKSLQQDLLMRQLCSELALTPLSRTDVQQLLSSKLQQETLPQGLASFVHLHSEGNPLFAIAIVEHMIAQRILVPKEIDGKPRWEQRSPFQELETRVPDGLAQMIELEIERLSPEDQRLLEAGSLMGIAFPLWAVAAALEEDTSKVEEACDALSRRLYFVKRAGQDELPGGARSDFYVFVHGVYREVLYERQSSTRRANRHIRIAKRLGELFAGRETDVAREMAAHYEAAGQWQLAASALCAAAQHAQRRHAYGEAMEQLNRALQISRNLSEQERNAAVRAIRDELKKMRTPEVEKATREKKISNKI